MFYACLTILILFMVMLFCVTIAIIDLETYNFGLYIVLLCIVGTMLACALCIANPNACANPTWYSNFCLMLQEMYPIAPDGSSSPKMNGLHSRIMALQSKQSAVVAAVTAASTQSAGGAAPESDNGSKLPLRQESRATVAMLAPAVHIMHQVWRGMAWVADGIDDDDDDEDATKSVDNTEQGLLTSESHSDVHTFKRLSTIAESSCSIVHECEPDGISSEYTSSHDVMV